MAIFGHGTDEAIVRRFSLLLHWSLAAITMAGVEYPQHEIDNFVSLVKNDLKVVQSTSLAPCICLKIRLPPPFLTEEFSSSVFWFPSCKVVRFPRNAATNDLFVHDGMSLRFDVAFVVKQVEKFLTLVAKGTLDKFNEMKKRITLLLEGMSIEKRDSLLHVEYALRKILFDSGVDIEWTKEVNFEMRLLLEGITDVFYHDQSHNAVVWRNAILKSGILIYQLENELKKWPPRDDVFFLFRQPMLGNEWCLHYCTKC